MPTRHLLIAATCFVLVLSGAAAAEGFNAEETQALLVQGPWKIQTGGEYNYFLWNSDGTLCVKQYDPSAESCDDSGAWTREGNRVCYKLQWWGKGVDLHDLCFQIVKAKSGNYEAIDDAGLAALYFTMVESD